MKMHGRVDSFNRNLEVFKAAIRLLGCDTMQSCRRIQTLRRNRLLPSLRFKYVGSRIGLVIRVWIGFKERGHETQSGPIGRTG
jgi:hypothetical protein